jgi:hypothetical protein
VKFQPLFEKKKKKKGKNERQKDRKTSRNQERTRKALATDFFVCINKNEQTKVACQDEGSQNAPMVKRSKSRRVLVLSVRCILRLTRTAEDLVDLYPSLFFSVILS